MAERVAAEVFPPGEYIKDELEERGWTQAALAERLGVSLAVMNDVIEGRRAMTREMAEALGDAFGTSVQVWLNLDERFQLESAITSRGARP